MRSETEQPCARCGAPIDPVFALMTGDGPVCKVCENAQIAREASATASASQFGPLGWGIVSLFCNVLFIPSILAITGGFRDLKSVRAAQAAGVREPSDSDRQTKAIVAIVLGALHPLALMAGIGLVVLSALFAAVTPAPRYDDYAYTHDDYGYDDLGGDYGDEPDPYAYDPGEDSIDDIAYGGSTADAVEALGAPSSRRVARLDATRPFADQVREHVARARAEGLRPYVYAHASWCPPCNAIARHAEDPRMVEAYAGTYILDVDIDVVPDAEMRAAGFAVRGIPAWYGVDAQGRYDGRMITGAAWGEDIPENMAPPLRRFFSPDAI